MSVDRIYAEKDRDLKLTSRIHLQTAVLFFTKPGSPGTAFVANLQMSAGVNTISSLDWNTNLLRFSTGDTDRDTKGPFLRFTRIDSE